MLLTKAQVKVAKDALETAKADLVESKRQADAAEAQVELDKIKFKNENMTSYIDDMSSALNSMASEFEKGNIPHDAGHQFEKLLENFESILDSIYDIKVNEEFTKLKNLLKLAKDKDKQLASDIYPKEELAALIKDLKRAAGDLRGQKGGIYAVMSLTKKAENTGRNSG